MRLAVDVVDITQCAGGRWHLRSHERQREEWNRTSNSVLFRPVLLRVHFGQSAIPAGAGTLRHCTSTGHGSASVSTYIIPPCASPSPIPLQPLTANHHYRPSTAYHEDYTFRPQPRRVGFRQPSLRRPHCLRNMPDRCVSPHIWCTISLTNDAAASRMQRCCCGLLRCCGCYIRNHRGSGCPSRHRSVQHSSRHLLHRLCDGRVARAHPVKR